MSLLDAVCNMLRNCQSFVKVPTPADIDFCHKYILQNTGYDLTDREIDFFFRVVQMIKNNQGGLRYGFL